MSVKIMGMVWDSALPRNEKAILLAYADHADHEGGNIYPSVGRIAWKTGYDERAVQRITKRLIDKGILMRQGEGPKRTNLYRIVVSALPIRPDYKEDEGGKIPPRQNSTPGILPPSNARNVTLEGGKIPPESSYNHPLKPSGGNAAELRRPPTVLAYKIFVEETKKTCLNLQQIKAINEAVGTESAALDKWRDTVKAWNLAGNKLTNAGGMLDWYKTGKRSNYDPNKFNGQPEPTPPAPPPLDDAKRSAYLALLAETQQAQAESAARAAALVDGGIVAAGIDVEREVKKVRKNDNR